MASNRTDGQQGTFDALKIEATDDNDAFIEWKSDQDEYGRAMYKAVGTDGKIYTIKRDEAVPGIVGKVTP